MVFEPQATTDAQPGDAPKASSTKLVPKMPPPVRAPAKRPASPRREDKHKSHLVVDGSNIATEGRNLPSMAQLEDALDAFVKEHPFNVVTVIVDATFGHRISPKEKRWYEEAISSNGMITPPAGAIGRGDAFILEVARRADAVVLSNDSFQEFHGAHPWLFEEGRLYGGKPIPHVGWVFVPRAPVRGATSRRAVRTAQERDTETVPHTRTPAAKPEATPRAASTAAAKADVPATATATKADATARTRVEAKPEPAAPPERRPRRSTRAPREATTKRGAATTSTADVGDATSSPPQASPVTPRATTAPSSTDDGNGKDAKSFNDAAAYRAFARKFPVGAPVDITIERFSSHGAYGSHGDVVCYIPTKLLSEPPPARARDVLRIGSVVTLHVHTLHDDTRGIDLAAFTTSPPHMVYAGARRSTPTSSDTESSVDETSGLGNEEPTRRGELVAAKKKAAKKSTKKAAKKAPAKKAAKKAPAKKAAKKTAKKATKKTAKKATKRTAKKAGGRKKAAKKAGGRKKAAKRATKKA